VTNEQKRIIIAAVSGFMIGRTIEQYRMFKKRNEAVKKAGRREDQLFWKTIQRYLEDPRDNRTIEQLIEDWQTNQKFHEVIRNEYK
jgi:hypothetical protein